MKKDVENKDPIETLIGQFGRYQSLMLIFVLIGRFPTEFQLNNVVFVIPGVEYVCLDANANNATNFCPCENPQYDQSAIASSVTSEWNLICGRTFLASLAQSMLQVGILVGSLFYGHLADRYGRKKAALLAMAVEIIFILLSAVIPEFWMFLVFRFLIGTSVGGVMLCFYVLIVELSGKSFRPYAVGLLEISYVLGYFTLAVLAYFVRYWRHLMLITSIPWIVTLSFYWAIPESPRWLITAGKKREAVELLTIIAKMNNRPTTDVENVVNKVYEESIKNQEQNASYLDLFKTPKIRKYSIVMALIWMFCAATFFGVNQYIGRLKGNLYVNVMIAAAFHAPGIVIAVAAMLNFRRKISVIASFSVAGMSLLVFLFLPYSMQTAYLTFAVVGLIAAFISFMQIYLYSSEVFPTVVRNSALGLASMCARFGGFLSPFVVNIGIELVSVLIFSGLAFSAAILCCFLPETKDIVLLNTIDETERQDDKDKENIDKANKDKADKDKGDDINKACKRSRHNYTTNNTTK